MVEKLLGNFEVKFSDIQVITEGQNYSMTDMTTTICSPIFDPRGHKHRKFSGDCHVCLYPIHQLIDVMNSVYFDFNRNFSVFRLPEHIKNPKIDSCN